MYRARFVKNGIYHLYNRSKKPFRLFSDRDDYIWFLRKLKYYIRTVPSTVVAYALMPNHFHFLMRQEAEIPLSKLVNSVFSVYVRHYNHKYGRKGSLLEDRVKYKPILKDEYFIYLCLYIHANPLDAGLVSDLEEWEYSNYLEWIGLRNGSLFSREIVDEYFPNKTLYKEKLIELREIKKNRKFLEIAEFE